MRYAYDIECFINLFTATFINVDDESDNHTFVIGLGINDREDLAKFLRNRITLIGYNNHSYDDPMIRFVVKNPKVTNRELFNLSSDIINSDMFNADPEIKKLRYPRDPSPWNSIDLMKIMAFDKLGISLKQTAINLKWHKIQDMPISPYADVDDKSLKTVLDYNRNDVLITKKLYEKILPLIQLREELSKIYHVNLTSASDSKMANLIFEHIYGTELKMDIRSIRDMRTERYDIPLNDCIAPFVKFTDPYLQERYAEISSMVVSNINDFKYSTNAYFANCVFNLGIGGLHTEDEPAIFVSDENYIIRDMDVASYYPNLIINNNFYPKHLGMDFIRVLKKITEERIAAKKSKDKVKADGLKVTINSIFGKLGSPTFWLLDAKQMLSTTVSGQLGLLMLIEDLHHNGIEIISANTDGVVCKIPRRLENVYFEVAKRWQEKTNLELEFTTYKKYVRRDVNNYITEKESGETKEKGIFVKEVDLKKGYRMPIVAKALHAYFIKGIPVRQTLEECNDIMEFCLSQKTGGQFSVEFHTTKGIQKLQKTNRYFVSKKGGLMMKRSAAGKLISLQAGKTVQILNDYDENTPFEDYQVDLNFYEKEVMKIVDEIEPKQLTLFNFGDIEKTEKKNYSVQKAKTVSKQEDIPLTIKEINKLGKNQFFSKLESIVDSREIIKEISPRYVFVVGFDSKSMEVDVYCLGKGTYQTLIVNNSEYKKKKLEKGMLLYCSKFKKLEYEYELSEYKICEKIEEEKKGLF